MVTARSVFALILIATFVLSFAYFFVIPALETETTRPAVFEENPVIALGTNQTPVLAYNLSDLIYDDFEYNGTFNAAKWTATGGIWTANGTHLLLNNSGLNFLTSSAPIQTAGIAGIRVFYRNTQPYYSGASTSSAFSFGLLKDFSFEFLAGFTILENGTAYSDIYAGFVNVVHEELGDLTNGSVVSWSLIYYNNGTLIFGMDSTELILDDPSYINPSSEAYLLWIDNGLGGSNRLYCGDVCNFSQPFPTIHSYPYTYTIVSTSSDGFYNRTAWIASDPLLPLPSNWYGYYNSQVKNLVRSKATVPWYPYIWYIENTTTLLRFRVDIPQDSTITSANISLYCSEKSGALQIAVQLLTYTNCPTFSDNHLYCTTQGANVPPSELPFTYLHQVTFNAVNGWNTINMTTLIEDFIGKPYYVRNNWIGLRIMPVVNMTNIFTTGKIYIASSDSGDHRPTLKVNYKIADYQAFILALTANFQKASFVSITEMAFDASILQLSIQSKINLPSGYAAFDCQLDYTLFETVSFGLYNLSFKNYNTLALKTLSMNEIHAGLEYHNLYNMSQSNANKYYFNYILFDSITSPDHNYLLMQYLNFENIVLNIGINSVSALLTQLNPNLHSYFYVQGSGLYFHFNTSYNAFSRLNFTLATSEALQYTYITLTAKATVPNVCTLALYTDNPLNSWNTMPLPILFSVGSAGVGRASFYYQQADNCTQFIVQCTSNSLYPNQTAAGYIIEMAFTTRTEITQALVNMPNLILALIILIVPGGLGVKLLGKGAFAPLLLVSDVACLYLGLLQWWVGIPVAVIALFIIFEGRN
jgi:hypothetical protein